MAEAPIAIARHKEARRVGDDLTMFQISDLLAREAIRDLAIRYNSYGDSGLFDRMLELFASDAILEVDGDVYEGRDEIRNMFSRVPVRTSKGGGRPAYLRHCTSTHQIDLVDETRATGRCYFFVLTAVGLDHWGRYLDEYRVVNGEWCFTRRRVLTDALSPQSLFAAEQE
jgi:SnoaL-like protein